MRLTGYNSQAMLRNFMEILVRNGYRKYYVFRDYVNGHAVLVSDNKYNPNIYFLYKRQPFFHFNKIFKELIQQKPELDGYGESVNLEVIQRCENYKCSFIAIVHPDNVYVAPFNLIKNFCITNRTIRGQNRLNDYIQRDSSINSKSEVTFSFPQAILSSFENMFPKKEVLL